MTRQRAEEIRGVWDALDGDISTERLMQMVADTCKCDAGDVAEALAITEGHATASIL